MVASTGLRGIPSDVEVFEIGSSTNMTASDLPGPGRILGRVYKKLGGYLETILNDTPLALVRIALCEIIVIPC